MLHQCLSDRVQIVDTVSGWKEAVRLACTPLINDNSIRPEYLEAIYTATEKLGPYYVLAPQIAMPHARPEEGVLQNSLSLLVIKEGINFGSLENDPVNLVLLLAAKNSNQHIEMLTSISDFLCNDEDVQSVIKAESIEKILNTLEKY